MKKILVVFVTVLAFASFAPSQTGDNGSGLRGGGNVRPTIMRMAHLPGRTPACIKGAASTSQCTLTFITESLQDFTVGVPVKFNIEACCGTPPYSFEITGGTLPDGLHLNKNGKITGKPTEVTDTTVFVTLTDSAGCSITQAFAVRAVAP